MGRHDHQKKGVQNLMLPIVYSRLAKRQKAVCLRKDDLARRIKKGIEQFNSFRQNKNDEALAQLDIELQPLVAQLYDWSDEMTQT